jgi:single-stranded DNA-binding protein
MAQIIQDPELRYTPDSQTAVAQMLVQFPSQRSEDPPITLKVVGWGNFAQEIKETYSVGDQVVIEGRLSMNTIDRPEGFKEKRAELVASRIYKLGADTVFEPHSGTSSTTFDSTAAVSSSKSNNVVVPIRPSRQPAPMSEPDDLDNDYAPSATEPTFEPATARRSTSANLESQQNLDDIPF